MIKIEQTGIISNGKLYLDDRDVLNTGIKSFLDCSVKLTVEKFTGQKTKKQQGYYWATIVPHTLIILRDICGYSEYQNTDQAHTFLKYLHNPVEVPSIENPEIAIRLPDTTKKMSKERKMKYIDDIIMWAWDKFNYTYPPPKKKDDKYYFS